MPHVVLDDSLADNAALGVQGQFHLAVLQRDVLPLAVQGRVEQGRRVGCRGSLLLCLLRSGELCVLRFPGCSDGVLHELGPLLCHLFGRRLLPPGEPEEYQGDENKPCNRILIHLFIFLVFY